MSCSQESGDAVAGGSAVCDFCQTAVQYIKIALDSNETITQVTQGPGQGELGAHAWRGMKSRSFTPPYLINTPPI